MTINPAFSYIQLHPHGKVPTREWAGDDRQDISIVRDWLAQGYNLGVRTDLSSGCWVLDVDVNVETLEPSDEWKALVAEHELPPTYTVRSPSGGLHYYFRFPEGITVRNDQGRVICKDVDIRGVGGYVVAAGMRATYTKHQREFAGTYDVIDDSAIALTPQWIVDRLVEREEKAAEKKERVNNGEIQPKADVIEDEWDSMAKQELNQLFAKVSELAALPEGESLEILGEERGWERGAGFFVLACKIIEVARWPHTSITVEQAQKVWADRVPAKYAVHDWQNAVETADTTWRWGEQQRTSMDWFDAIPNSGKALAPERGDIEEGPWEPLDVSDRPNGYGVGALFAMKKDDEPGSPSGGLLVDAARRHINQIGPIAIDPTGSLWTYQHGVYVYDDKCVLDRLFHALGDRFTSTHLTNVKLAVQASAPRLDLTRPPNPGLMNFTNGVLEWRYGDELTQHDPGRLTTTQFPYEWDAEATCPKFDHWLETMLEPDQVKLAWKILGYLMLSGNPLQVAFMLYGKGSNGKSTFAHIAERLVGMSNTSAVALKDFNARFQTSAMIGKIANVVGDIDSDYQMATATLKQITGADALQFERKNRDSFRATLWATCLFSANKIPGTSDGSEGYAERWVPLNFKRKAADHRIEGFSEEGLWGEIAGIAAKAVRALRTLPIHHGADRSAAFDLTSTSALAAVEDFRVASSSYYAWVKTHTAPSDEIVVKPKELWAAYKSGTGTRHGGTNCPQAFAEVLAEAYGEPRMARGSYLGVSRNVRGYRVTIMDDDEVANMPADPFAGLGLTS